MNIDVYDNFFPTEVQKDIWYLLQRPRWSPHGGEIAHNPDSKKTKFWHMDNLEKEDFFNTFLYDLICKNLNINYNIARIYANGQNGGQSGNYHIDDGDITFLYYPNPEWKVEWGGHLVFLNKEETETNKIVSYKPNRAVIFPSEIPHAVDGISRFYPLVRMSLAYKFLIPE